jgi:DNA-binding NarL/FixJ family response regulator
MPVMNGVQATRSLRDLFPDLYVLILTTFADDEWIFDALRAGASGYLLKDTRRADLVAAIKRTVTGETFLDPQIAGKLVQQVASSPALPAEKSALSEKLTQRELDVLRLLVKGYNNPDIARRLYLAPGTVRNYVSAIFQKLGVSDRTQAAVLAVRHGLVEEDV